MCSGIPGGYQNHISIVFQLEACNVVVLWNRNITLSDFVQRFLLAAMAGAWLSGIMLASLLPHTLIAVKAPLIAVCALFVLIAALLFRYTTHGHYVLLLLGCLLLGAARYGIALPDDDPQAISQFVGRTHIMLQGNVADEPEVVKRHRQLTIAVTAVSTDSGTTWHNAHGDILVLLNSTLVEDPYGANYGDQVELNGTLQPPLPGSPPEIFASMAFPKLRVSASGGNPLIAWLYHLRILLATLIQRALPQPEAALLIALLLSLRTPPLLPISQSFNLTGTAHLIAPSGFKVTILAGIVQQGTRWLYEKRQRRYTLNPLRQRMRDWRYWLATTLVLLTISMYTLLSGGGPAALRAGIMGCLLVLAPRIGRTYNVYTALAFTALLLSLFDPFMLWSASFQLSFAGTLGIILLTPPLQHYLHPLTWLPLGHLFHEIFAVTLAAQLATLPILALTFQQVSFIAPLANILTVPLLGTFLLLGLLVCLVSLLVPAIGILAGWIAWPILWYLITVVNWCADLPGAYITVNNLSSGIAWGYYALLALATLWVLHRHTQTTDFSKQEVSKHPAHPPRRLLYVLQGGAALLILLVTGALASTTLPDHYTHIDFLSVAPGGQPAQGEAILLRTPDGKTILIDGGSDASSLAMQLGSLLPPWQHTLDTIILTSMAADHLTGLQDVVNSYQIGHVFDAGMLYPSSSYALWRRTIRERNIPYTQLRLGMTIVLGAQTIAQVLWPSTLLHNSNPNRDNALVLRLLAPGLSLLLLGETSYSTYALKGILNHINSNPTSADIVEIIGDVGKTFPATLAEVIQLTHPSLLIVTPGTLPKKRRSNIGSSGTMAAAPATTMLNTSALVPLVAGTTIQVLQIAQVGTLEINANAAGWNTQHI